MLKDKTKTLQIIKHMSQSIKKPFSIKTRIGLSQDDCQAQKDFILASAEYCQTITIHGRTYRQSHSGQVDRDFIYQIKDILGDRIKVFGNGGITSYQDMCTHQGNLDGVMIGQSAIGNPRIFTPDQPSVSQRYHTILKHLRLSCLLELYIRDPIVWDIDNQMFIQPDLDNLLSQINHIDLHPDRNTCHSVIEFRKYLFNYIHGLPGNRDLKIQVAQVKDYDTLRDLICRYMEQLES